MPTENRSSSGGYTAVACKIPNGVVLKTFKMVPHREPIMGGGWRDCEVAQWTGEKFVLNGPKRDAMNVAIHGSAFINMVPTKFWEEWLAQNHESTLVVNKQVFSAISRDEAAQIVRKLESEPSGFEPISRDTDAKGNLIDKRVPRLNKAIQMGSVSAA